MTGVQTCALPILQNQSAYRAEYLAEARKWVIENNLAWCSYKATIDQYEKYVEGKTSTGEETKPEKKTFAQKALGVAKTAFTYGTGIGLGLKVAKTFLDKTDVGKLIKSGAKKILDFTKNLYKKYNYNAKAKEVMDKAGDVIADTWTKADPDFYGQNKSAPDMTNAPKYDANDIGDPTANLGGLSTGENFIYKVNDLRDRVKKVTSKPMEKLERIAEPSKKMLDKIVSTAKSGIIKNSASSDFSETFGKEIVARLNILDEMHKENLRHNQVSEEFFAAALQMMSVIAQNSGNKQMSSVMTDMVKMVTQL